LLALRTRLLSKARPRRVSLRQGRAPLKRGSFLFSRAGP
jgi:hypothetical protein